MFHLNLWSLWPPGVRGAGLHVTTHGSALRPGGLCRSERNARTLCACAPTIRSAASTLNSYPGGSVAYIFCHAACVSCSDIRQRRDCRGQLNSAVLSNRRPAQPAVAKIAGFPQSPRPAVGFAEVKARLLLPVGLLLALAAWAATQTAPLKDTTTPDQIRMLPGSATGGESAGVSVVRTTVLVR